MVPTKASRKTYWPLQVLKVVTKTAFDYKYWITAVAWVHQEEIWVLGHSGKVIIHQNDFGIVS